MTEKVARFFSGKNRGDTR